MGPTKLDRKMFIELCRLYECGCTHDEALASLHATTQAHADRLDWLCRMYGYDGLVDLKDWCSQRAKASLKSRLFSQARETGDQKVLVAALQVLAERDRSEIPVPQDVIDSAARALGIPSGSEDSKQETEEND